MEAKAFSFNCRTKVFADGTVRKTARDLRRTGKVSGGTGVSRPISDSEMASEPRQ